MKRLEQRMPGATALAISIVLTGAFAIWEPPLRDLAAHTFRADYFGEHGLALWNGSWYGGHYMLGYSILFPPLSWLLTPEWAGMLSAVACAYLFDRLVRTQWGDGARWGSYIFASLGAVALLANGWLAFALGLAFALASLRALQTGHGLLATLAALASALSSPVAAVFLALVLVAGWAAGPRTNTRAVAATTFFSLAPVALFALIFPEEGRFPYWFSAWWPLPLLCITALLAVRGIPGERRFRVVVAVYLAVGTLIYVVPNQVGGNATRLGSLFGAPLVAAIVFSKGARVPRPFVWLALTVGIAWLVITPLPDTIQSLGDPSTEAAYYKPLNAWLATHGAKQTRTEIPFTFNHWETAHVTPEFPLARGWLRQLDTERNKLFYEGELTDARYLAWLHEKGIRYVARSDAQLDYSAQIETDLIDAQPPYLKQVAKLDHWTIYEVAGATPLVSGQRGERLIDQQPESFTLDVKRPGAYLVRVWHSPYWSVEKGDACVGRSGDWTLVRAQHPGIVKIRTSFSASRAWRAVTGADGCHA